MDIKPEILYEDEGIIVCHKEAGVPVQSGRVGEQDMVSILLNYLSEKQQKVPYLGLIHRLDQPVEGIIVFAKNKKAASDLSRQVSDGTMKKIYLAVCCDSRRGQNTDDRENVSLVNYLKKDSRTNTSSIVEKNVSGAKRSELSYRILKKTEIDQKDYVLAEITLMTGRHHQIRVQMAGAGYPLYGDRKYNNEWESYRIKEYGSDAGAKLALCAASLEFCHPVSKKVMKFSTKPSSEIFTVFSYIL